MAAAYPSLLHIMIANAALHMSMMGKRDRVPAFTAHHVVALAAKQHALEALNEALSHMSLADIDAILGIVLLFVEFDLISSGSNDWRQHVHSTCPLVKMIYEPGNSGTTMTPLRRCLVSHCLVYPSPMPHCDLVVS
ncbi:uncharacterized protein RHO25_010256 [Cercospora beticola]|uniref:Uncharacterized protein n=1 Tax=Cercospora beticola TaxID=122368 RepID=A0ABZ0P163_CERBT|nr:hypothetical protein RHO25_010256 [Cercospora beticola]